MGTTYSIFEDIPPSITFLNNQKQSMEVDARLIIFYLEPNDENAAKVHLKYHILISKLKNKGFIVLTICRNLNADKIITDPSNGMMQAVIARMRQIQMKYLKRNITILIPSVTFISLFDSCGSLLKVFDTTDYLKDKSKLYDKLRSNNRTATIKTISNENTITYEDFTSRITSIVLINPSLKSVRDMPKYIKVEKEVRIIYTDDHNRSDSKNSILNRIQKICYGGFVGDRIKDAMSNDLILSSRRNIGEKDKKSKSIDTFVTHIIDGIYEAIDK
jgi:hypothetical protein